MSKLTREDKIEIYERRLKGETISSIAKSFNMNKSNIKYLINLIKKHGYDVHIKIHDYRFKHCTNYTINYFNIFNNTQKGIRKK